MELVVDEATETGFHKAVHVVGYECTIDHTVINDHTAGTFLVLLLVNSHASV